MWECCWRWICGEGGVACVGIGIGIDIGMMDEAWMDGRETTVADGGERERSESGTRECVDFTFRSKIKSIYVRNMSFKLI
jgi:hypothetical protein